MRDWFPCCQSSFDKSVTSLKSVAKDVEILMERSSTPPAPIDWLRANRQSVVSPRNAHLNPISRARIHKGDGSMRSRKQRSRRRPSDGHDFAERWTSAEQLVERYFGYSQPVQ